MKYKKILIVDDDPISLKMLKKVFDSSEYFVLSAYSGTEALRVVNNDHPDLIILDIVMPDIDGGDVANILRNNPVTKKIPIIFLSSLISKVEEKSSSHRDGIFLMAKPFNRDKLIRIVRQQT